MIKQPSERMVTSDISSVDVDLNNSDDSGLATTPIEVIKIVPVRKKTEKSTTADPPTDVQKTTLNNQTKKSIIKPAQPKRP